MFQENTSSQDHSLKKTVMLPFVKEGVFVKYFSCAFFGDYEFKKKKNKNKK